MLIVTLVFEKYANFFAENCQKAQKIVIITSTPGSKMPMYVQRSSFMSPWLYVRGATVECHPTKCHPAECHFSECHPTQCHPAECHLRQNVTYVIYNTGPDSPLLGP
jgi:hypothetical protein